MKDVWKSGDRADLAPFSTAGLMCHASGSPRPLTTTTTTHRHSRFHPITVLCQFPLGPWWASQMFYLLFECFHYSSEFNLALECWKGLKISQTRNVQLSFQCKFLWVTWRPAGAVSGERGVERRWRRVSNIGELACCCWPYLFPRLCSWFPITDNHTRCSFFRCFFFHVRFFFCMLLGKLILRLQTLPPIPNKHAVGQTKARVVAFSSGKTSPWQRKGLSSFTGGGAKCYTRSTNYNPARPLPCKTGAYCPAMCLNIGVQMLVSTTASDLASTPSPPHPLWQMHLQWHHEVMLRVRMTSGYNSVMLCGGRPHWGSLEKEKTLYEGFPSIQSRVTVM